MQNPWISANWTDYNTGIETTWEIINDAGNKALRHVATGGKRVYANYTGTDYTFSARMKPGHLGTSAGIVARFTDDNHYYGLTLESATIALRKFPHIAAPVSEAYTFDTSTWYTLTLKVSGTTITGTVTDGTTTATVTIHDDGTYDSNPCNASGKIGLSELVQDQTCFDDIKVTEP